ncbi:MerR family transcriptional regulator [Heyndrickxia coagulans]|uniref:MerR family transcriptional regulator n=1 Tax=Heyndrickxia coagulans TaxID=1398 RepID=UPI00216B28E1|nr:MerR family transcriptional regulator [Heyndrickxia coagulans]MED4313065.1 MerR family transcriptional regulator [Heyndrickxia coagulans]
MRYYSIHEFSKLINRTPQTLRNWDKSGKLKPHHTGSTRTCFQERIIRISR